MLPTEQGVALTKNLSGLVMDYVFQLAGEALTANPAVPLHRYVLAAQRLLIEADRQGASGDLLKRSVLLVRFVRLVTKTLPQHPAWSLESNRALRDGLRDDAKRVLADLEQLRVDLAAQWSANAEVQSSTAGDSSDVIGSASLIDSMSQRQDPEQEPNRNRDAPHATTVRPPKDVFERSTQPLLLPEHSVNHPGQDSRVHQPAMAQNVNWLESPAGQAYIEECLRGLMAGSRFIRDMFCETWHSDPSERKRRMVLYLLEHANIPVHRATLAVADLVLNEYLLISGQESTLGGEEASQAPECADQPCPLASGTRAVPADQQQPNRPRMPAVSAMPGVELPKERRLLQPDAKQSIERTLRSLQKMELMTDADGPEQATSSDDGDFGAAWHSQWCVDFQTLIIGPKIGSGGYGEVFVGRFRDQLVAIKHLQPVDGVYSPEMLRSFRDEMMLMSRLSHPNIVRFIGACINPPNLCILSEYVHGGTLYRLLQKRRRKRLDPSTGEPTGEMVVTEHLPWCGVLRIALGIARGMRYLHAQKPIVVHRDLKSPNCLVFSASSPVLDDISVEHSVDAQPSPRAGSLPQYGGPIRANEDFSEADAKLIDFGLSRTQLKSYISTGIAGTPEWMAPEVIRQDKVSESADVFSFGVILWELVTGRKPWEHLTQTQVVYRVGYLEEVLQLPPEAHPRLRALNTAACQMNPMRRPKFADIVIELEHLCRESGVSTETGEALVGCRHEQQTRTGYHESAAAGP
ncbi:hypothetical protein F1559_001855 [Cyanidiococcus yangmingshanensis]|uniref:Protein kinase domain-containing protein n=1 Tax=Cyanidiococcus yangmingshanensis TaxID=2690220 RepID=A0A7J7ICP5_9RHOD|nr:hypothetical protein F1559_001855 [Cyanidiococcus yangmingshanensis]